MHKTTSPHSAALAILRSHRDSWPGRKHLVVTPKEMSALIAGGATIQSKNTCNGDGTYFCRVTLNGFTLDCSSIKPIV